MRTSMPALWRAEQRRREARVKMVCNCVLAVWICFLVGFVGGVQNARADMANIQIAEFSTFGMDPNTGEALAKTPPITEQAFAAVPFTSAPFNAATRFVRVHNGTAAGISIVFGTGVTVATTTNMRLAANQTEYFAVNAGDQAAGVANA